jgi:superfamily II DNA or RNA helicase
VFAPLPLLTSPTQPLSSGNELFTFAPGAADVIAAFAASGAEWLVSVRMVSEGVDIPCLRVEVYATTTRERLFLRQAVGRFVRTCSADEPDAVSALFMPSEPTLLEQPRQIENEIRHCAGEEDTGATSGYSEREGASGRPASCRWRRPPSATVRFSRARPSARTNLRTPQRSCGVPSSNVHRARGAPAGFDYPRHDTLLLAAPIALKGTLTQHAGRLHHPADGKCDARIYDYVDVAIPLLARMYAKRERAYRARIPDRVPRFEVTPAMC